MAVVHGVCALAVWLSTAGMLAFFGAWVLGVELAPLLSDFFSPMMLNGFFYVLDGATATAFVAGTLLVFFYNLLAGGARDGRT